MRRFTFAALALAALGLSGCIEGEQTFTLNPDGSGKVRIDVVMAPPAEFAVGPAKKGRPTLDEARQQSLKAMLKGQGVTAWKDVAAGFTPDGRFQFAGTAYFDKLDRLEFQNTGFLLGSRFALTPDKGGLVLAKKSARPGGPPGPDGPSPFGGPGRKSAAELAKLPDADLDAYILGDRVQFQGTRPMLLAALARGKMKTTYLLPGVAADAVGFKADGVKLVHELDGDKMVAGMDALFSRPDAELRPVYRKAGGLEAAAVAAFGVLPDDACRAAVPTPGGAQFDYAAEVKAARESYPALRKALGVADDFWIPDGNPPPPPKRPGT